ncbi:MAG: hypothetical protein HFI39_10060 [Lachnospiraceae bacterium]|nr:hypothetical protein [Lachnospiraceae bacterium]
MDIKERLRGMKRDMKFFFDWKRRKKTLLPVEYMFDRVNRKTGIFSDLIIYLGAGSFAAQSEGGRLTVRDRDFLRFFVPKAPLVTVVKPQVSERGKEVVQLQEKDICLRPDDSIGFLYGRYQQRVWRQMLEKLFPPEPSLYEQIQAAKAALFTKEDRVLGVLCRGTDYRAKRPKGHPVQPELSDVIQKAETVMKKRHCTKIFLATEDQQIADRMRKHFGEERVRMYQKSLFTDTKEQYLAEICPREEKQQIDREYVISMGILARCDCLIAGRTSGLVGVMLLAGKPFEYTYFWDLGVYGE